MNYEPTAIDIHWARNMLAMLKDGGVMVFPATRETYRVNHRTKTVTLISAQDETFDKTLEVFRRVGYETKRDEVTR